MLENLEDACVLTGPDDSLWDKHACPAYVGPEILSSRASFSGKAADVWSLGVVELVLVSGSASLKAAVRGPLGLQSLQSQTAQKRILYSLTQKTAGRTQFPPAC